MYATNITNQWVDTYKQWGPIIIIMYTTDLTNQWVDLVEQWVPTTNIIMYFTANNTATSFIAKNIICSIVTN